VFAVDHTVSAQIGSHCYYGHRRVIAPVPSYFFALSTAIGYQKGRNEKFANEYVTLTARPGIGKRKCLQINNEKYCRTEL
jgi:hypothetical protein